MSNYYCSYHYYCWFCSTSQSFHW